MSVTALDDAAWAGPWRGLSCTAKVCSAGALVSASLVLPPWPGAALLGVVGAALILGWARIPFRVFALALALPALSVLVGAASISLVVGQGATWSLGPAGWTPGSLRQGADVLIRGLAGTVGVFVLALTTPMVDLLGWGRRLRIPGPLLDIASLMYRLLFVTAASGVALVGAFGRRLGDVRETRRRWRNRGLLLAAIGTRTAARATRMELSLDLRGDLGSLRTLTHRTQPAPLLPAATLLAVAAAAALSWGPAWL